MIATLSLRIVNLTRPLLLAAALALGALAPVAPALAADCQAQYVVQKGDTLYTIGLKYNMTWDRIANANAITRPDKIMAGQALCIPPARTSSGGTGSDVKYIQARTDVNIRKGPGVNYGVLVILKGGQTAQVTGQSADGKWWRVICPDNTAGECYVSADPTLTQPAAAPGTRPTTPSTGKIPVIAIASVVADKTVTLTAADFPANEKFDVRLGLIGTQGINGTLVATTDSGQGGAFSATYNIPAALRGQTQIAIRLESKSGYFSYNWFWNTTATAN